METSRGRGGRGGRGRGGFRSAVFQMDLAVASLLDRIKGRAIVGGDWDSVVGRAQDIMEEYFSVVLQYYLEVDLEDAWEFLVPEKPPWNPTSMLDVLRKNDRSCVDLGFGSAIVYQSNALTNALKYAYDEGTAEMALKVSRLVLDMFLATPLDPPPPKPSYTPTISQETAASASKTGRTEAKSLFDECLKSVNKGLETAGSAWGSYEPGLSSVGSSFGEMDYASRLEPPQATSTSRPMPMHQPAFNQPPGLQTETAERSMPRGIWLGGAPVHNTLNPRGAPMAAGRMGPPPSLRGGPPPSLRGPPPNTVKAGPPPTLRGGAPTTGRGPPGFRGGPPPTAGRSRPPPGFAGGPPAHPRGRTGFASRPQPAFNIQPRPSMSSGTFNAMPMDTSASQTVGWGGVPFNQEAGQGFGDVVGGRGGGLAGPGHRVHPLDRMNGHDDDDDTLDNSWAFGADADPGTTGLMDMGRPAMPATPMQRGQGRGVGGRGLTMSTPGGSFGVGDGSGQAIMVTSSIPGAGGWFENQGGSGAVGNGGFGNEQGMMNGISQSAQAWGSGANGDGWNNGW